MVADEEPDEDLIKFVKISPKLHAKLMHLKIDRHKKSIDELIDELLAECGY